MSWPVKQNINFYTDEFRPPQLPQEIRNLLRYTLTAAVAGLVVFAVLLAAEFWLSQQLHTMQDEVTRLNLSIEDEQRRMPPLTLDPELESQRTQAKAALQNSQRVLTYLSQQNIEERISFTPLLSDLTDVTIKGVWLSGVSVFDRGEHLQLRGLAATPSQLSPYIEALSNRPAYSQRGFRRIDMEESDQSRDGMHFVLDTRAADGKGGGL